MTDQHTDDARAGDARAGDARAGDDGAGADPGDARPPWGIPIRSRRPRPLRGPTRGSRALLLVGHGSRCQISEAEMQTIGDRVSDAVPGVMVDVGFLEMTDPPAGVVLDDLVARGAEEIVVLPLVLLGAGHAKNDVPAVVVEGRRRHPGVRLSFGSPLGVTRPLVSHLGDAVLARGGQGLPLLVVARGTSDPDANGEACKAARLVGEWTGSPFVMTGFTGVTGPSVPEAADIMARLGHGRVAVAWWFLCHGKLIERGRRDLAEFAERTGTEVLDVGHLGPQADLVPLILERFGQAQAGTPVVNCDTCTYRAAWPGLEDRVGQAVGVGHSHLAEEHRHSGGTTEHHHH
jgi:sirohydrochlorin cobaltochelatase